MFRPEPLDLVLILVAVLLIFGPKRLPETAGAIGKAIREFRNSITGKEPEQHETEPKDASKDSGRDGA